MLYYFDTWSPFVGSMAAMATCPAIIQPLRPAVKGMHSLPPLPDCIQRMGPLSGRKCHHGRSDLLHFLPDQYHPWRGHVSISLIVNVEYGNIDLHLCCSPATSRVTKVLGNEICWIKISWDLWPMWVIMQTIFIKNARTCSSDFFWNHMIEGSRFIGNIGRKIVSKFMRFLRNL